MAYVCLRTPAPLVAPISSGIREALATPDIVDALKCLDSRLAKRDQTAFARFITDEIPRWRPLIDLTGIKAH